MVKRHKGNQVILFLPAYFEWLAGHISYYNYISKDSCIVGEQQHKECKLLPCFLSLLLIGFGTLTLCSQCTMHTTAFAGGVWGFLIWSLRCNVMHPMWILGDWTFRPNGEFVPRFAFAIKFVQKIPLLTAGPFLCAWPWFTGFRDAE